MESISAETEVSYLGEWKNCKNINCEVGPQESPCFCAITIINTTTICIIKWGITKLKMTDNKNYVEEVCDWAKNYSYCPQLLVKSNTPFTFINKQDVTEQRIQWGSNHTQHGKYFIPQMKQYWVSINNSFKIS